MKSKGESAEMTKIGCLLLVISIPIQALWSGYVLSVLWSWFIVPTFEIRAIGVLPAIGVSMVVRYLTYQPDTYTDERKSATERVITAMATSFLIPLFALVFGWILHGFM